MGSHGNNSISLEKSSSSLTDRSLKIQQKMSWILECELINSLSWGGSSQLLIGNPFKSFKVKGLVVDPSSQNQGLVKNGHISNSSYLSKIAIFQGSKYTPSFIYRAYIGLFHPSYPLIFWSFIGVIQHPCPGWF